MPHTNSLQDGNRPRSLYDYFDRSSSTYTVCRTMQNVLARLIANSSSCRCIGLSVLLDNLRRSHIIKDKAAASISIKHACRPQYRSFACCHRKYSLIPRPIYTSVWCILAHVLRYCSTMSISVIEIENDFKIRISLQA
jgi:hypothetical protein